MYNPYINEKLAQVHHQELLHEAEQQRLFSQLPRRHPQLMQNLARRFATFISLPFSAKKVAQPARMATGQL